MSETSEKTWDWAICQDGGVSDRFPTEAEARKELPEYPAGSTVEYEPDQFGA